ncbi:MAG: PadR family transcriptional regulator [Dehalococcoidia bacterium]
MRRKPGALLPLEISILGAAMELARVGTREFHGYLLAGVLREREGARMLTAHGTLYKALDRMGKAGLLESRWEDPEDAAREERPRRRLYHITGAGERALAVSAAAQTGIAGLRPEVAT